MCAGSHRVRFPPLSFCAPESLNETPRGSQGISSVGSATCVGDADITYPVASRNSPPVDERCVLLRSMASSGSIKVFRSWPTGDPFSSSSSSGQFDSTSSLAPSRGHHHHHRSYVPYPISSTYGFSSFSSAVGALNCVWVLNSSTVTPSLSRSESHRGRLSTQRSVPICHILAWILVQTSYTVSIQALLPPHWRMDRKHLVRRGCRSTLLARFLSRTTLHRTIGTTHRRWLRHPGLLPFLLASAHSPLFPSSRRILYGKTSTTP